MNSEELRAMDAPALGDYIWTRFRREHLDPPLEDRFGAEEPEAFVLAAIHEDQGDFKAKLVEAIRRNLARLASYQADRNAALWRDRVFDEQLASLAFLAVETEAEELGSPFYELALPWVLSPTVDGGDWTLGQQQVVRAIAWLPGNQDAMARFWEELWKVTPLNLRGLVIFGWARADARQALPRVEDLLELEGQIDLPGVLTTLIQRPGPGADALGRAARKFPAEKRDRLLAVLADDVGATVDQLIDFARKAEPSERAVCDHLLAGFWRRLSPGPDLWVRVAREVSRLLVTVLKAPKDLIDAGLDHADECFPASPFREGRVYAKLVIDLFTERWAQAKMMNRRDEVQTIERYWVLFLRGNALPGPLHLGC